VTGACIRAGQGGKAPVWAFLFPDALTSPERGEQSVQRQVLQAQTRHGRDTPSAVRPAVRTLEDEDDSKWERQFRKFLEFGEGGSTYNASTRSD
jgi:hypothetical protein